ncbi:MAG: hypothetical protein IPK63_23275 [Candidatus Competibacteraceae bacterium]|nr:hypothetical protein [Candidatus Competibacteraceae bacterium]
MSDGLDVKAGYTPEDVAALLETLRGMVDLEDGELYTLRKGRLHHVVRREEDNGLRRILIMDDAYDAAQQQARRLRQRMRGYRPDPALVVSALVMHGAKLDPAVADDIAIQYLQQLFQRADAGADAESTVSTATDDAGLSSPASKQVPITHRVKTAH